MQGVRNTVPIPRDGVYELYWYFVSERQVLFEKRIAGLPGPWTADPILQEYKFCNTFRAADRVSQYMIRSVCYSANAGSLKDLAFQIVAFRTFSNIATWEFLCAYFGHPPRVCDLQSGDFEYALEAARRTLGKLYTGAFILCATDAFGRKVKHLNHIELFRAMFVTGDAYERIVTAPSLRAVYDILHTYPLMGDFMSYQIAIDINYSELLRFSENDFTKAGPGALRGIRKVFSDTNGLSPEECIQWMVANQEHELRRLGLPFHGLFGRSLHAIDAQNVFCETDKYCRKAVPELASARTHIKTRFQQSLQPLELFFPPKWNINQHAGRSDLGAE